MTAVHLPDCSAIAAKQTPPRASRSPGPNSKAWRRTSFVNSCCSAFRLRPTMPQEPVMAKPIPLPAIFHLDGVVEYEPVLRDEPLRALTLSHRDGRMLCRTGV